MFYRCQVSWLRLLTYIRPGGGGGGGKGEVAIPGNVAHLDSFPGATLDHGFLAVQKSPTVVRIEPAVTHA